MKRLLLLLPFIFLISCGNEENNTVFKSFETSNLSLSSKLEKACDTEYLNQLGCSDDEANLVKSIYQKQKYTPFWINDSTITTFGDSLKKLLSNPVNVCLPKGRILTLQSENYIQDELVITLASIRGASDFAHGFIDIDSNEWKKRQFLNIDSSLIVLNSIKRKDSIDIRKQFSVFAPNDSNYRRIYDGVLTFMDEHVYDTTHFQVKSIKEDHEHAFVKAQEALLQKGYITEKGMNGIDSLFLDSIIKIYQIDNGLKPDGVIGKYTAKSLNESTEEKIHRGILTLEKIRNHNKYPSKYILINLPEYQLRFIESDTLRSQHRIVIGKPENQTPELESKLSKIIVYPYWNVPYSISSKEILPVLKYNVGYLAKNNYKLYRNGELVDPYTVNWKKISQNSFPYKVVQDPGPKNSLGIIKFDFSNSHSVYFHDTPSKSLFSTDVRAYSHGCMRTQSPVELAKKILEYDSIPRRRNDIIPDSLDSLLARGNNYEIRLLDRIPIYIIYQTVTADENGMIIHPDVYDRDKKYLKTLLGNSQI